MHDLLFRATLLMALAGMGASPAARADVFTCVDKAGRVNISNLDPPADAHVTSVVHVNAPKVTPAAVAQAIPAEQAAYQALLKLQARETAVTRGRRGGGGGGGGQANQRQIDQLDLQQAENRYETQRQAQAPQTKQRTEELAVMNRLQELIPGGDHTIGIGSVIAAEASKGEPLVWYRGEYR